MSHSKVEGLLSSKLCSNKYSALRTHTLVKLMSIFMTKKYPKFVSNPTPAPESLLYCFYRKPQNHHNTCSSFFFSITLGFSSCLIPPFLSEEILKLFDALPLICTRLTLLEKLFMHFLSFISYYVYLWLCFIVCTIVWGARNNQYSILLSCSSLLLSDLKYFNTKKRTFFCGFLYFYGFSRQYSTIL